MLRLSAKNYLDLFLRLFCRDVDGCSFLEAVLIVATRRAFVLGFARQAVGMTAHRTLEHINLVFVDAPASAVRRTAVKAVRLAGLRLLNAQQ